MISVNRLPNRYCWNHLIPQTNANASFSICEYFCFESDDVRDAKDMGLSPPGPLCDNTAPSPFALASQDNTGGRSGIKWVQKLLQRQSISLHLICEYNF